MSAEQKKKTGPINYRVRGLNQWSLSQQRIDLNLRRITEKLDVPGTFRTRPVRSPCG